MPMRCERPSDGRALDHPIPRRLADFANGGQKALLAKPLSGRPSKLSAKELSWIASAVSD